MTFARMPETPLLLRWFGWWLWRAFVQRIALVRRRIVGDAPGIVPGVVLVGEVAIKELGLLDVLERLNRRKHWVWSPDPPVRPAHTSGLQELHCPPGTERAVATTIRRALNITGAETPVTRLPEVRWESGVVLKDTVLTPAFDNALSSLGIAKVAATAGADVVVGILDVDIRPDLIPCQMHDIELDAPDGESISHTVDVELHGTAVTALVHALAPGATLVRMDRLDNLSFWLPSVLRKLEKYAGHQPVVLNLSMSYVVEALYDDERLRFESMVDGQLMAYKDSMVVVAAAGNDHPLTPMAFPARSKYVVAVCAATHEGKLADNSRRGGKPGGGWYLAPGGYHGSAPAPLVTVNANKLAFHGTSMACALASGFIARELAESRCTPEHLRDVLQDRCGGQMLRTRQELPAQ